jgi:hypothetical protein
MKVKIWSVQNCKHWEREREEKKGVNCLMDKESPFCLMYKNSSFFAFETFFPREEWRKEGRKGDGRGEGLGSEKRTKSIMGCWLLPQKMTAKVGKKEWTSPPSFFN